MRNSETEKYQNKRNNIVDIRDRVEEIKIDDVLIGGNAQLYLINNYVDN